MVSDKYYHTGEKSKQWPPETGGGQLFRVRETSKRLEDRVWANFMGAGSK